MKNRLTVLARQLRRNQTEAERQLWYELRGRRLLGWKFKRQVPKGNYIVDFVCEEKKLVLELDGGQHAKQQLDYDEQRSADLVAMGYQVLRFWNKDVLTNRDGVLTKLLDELNKGESK